MKLFLIAAAAAILTVRANASSQPEIAITIDDLPVHAGYPPGMTALDVNRQMIAALKAGHVPATAFVNAVKVKDASTMEALRDWRAAGFVLGNHGWSHRHLSEMSVDQFEKELTRNEPILGQLGSGTDWRWFRYPFVDEGRDPEQRIAARQVLAKHGYRIAAVSMSFSDWAFTDSYARCTAKHDTAAVAELERLYMQSARDSITESRDAAHKLFGRDVPYVLLTHVSAMSAHMMPQLLELYRKAGFRFVSLPKAESDPLYRGYGDPRAPPPPSPQELASEKHVKLERAPDHSARLNAICA